LQSSSVVQSPKPLQLLRALGLPLTLLLTPPALLLRGLLNAALASTMERTSRIAESLIESLKQASTLAARAGPGRPCRRYASNSCEQAETNQVVAEAKRP
jgi:hypothetical protein